MGGEGRGSGPPRLAEGVLKHLLAPRDRAAILGDLAEEHRRRRGDGALAADAWYWRETLRSVFPALRRRFTDAGRRLLEAGVLVSPGGLLQDLRFGARSLKRTPGLALSVVVVLALGIGANSAVFSAVNAVLLRPLPYPDSDRLVAVWPGQDFSRQLLVWAREGTAGALDGVAGYGGALLTLSGEGPPTELFATEVSTNWLDVLGVRPALGRGFTAEDGKPGAEPTVVLSHDLWRRRFGADPDILGRSISLGGNGTSRRTVVGVLPRDYQPIYGQAVDAWIPVVVDPTSGEYGGSFFMYSIARLGPGVGLEAARAQVRRFAESARERDPSQYSEQEVARADVVPLGDELAAEVRPPILAVFAGVLLVLLVACGNVAILLLARAAARGRELAVKAALGAGGFRLARQALVESLALALVGAGGGLLLARQARPFFVRHLPSFVPPEAVGIDAAVIAFALTLAVGAALLGSLGPALGAARRDPAEALTSTRGSKGDRGGARLQHLLVGGQLALATALVVASALLAKSGRRLLEVDPGFSSRGVLTLRVTLPADEHPDDASVHRFWSEARDALAGAPGVIDAGFVSRLPMGNGTSSVTVTPEGFERAEGEPAPTATHRLVTPGYLEAVRARLLSGRLIGPDDGRAEPLGAVVNRTFVERFWPGETGIGKALMGPGGTAWLRIVGIVDDLQEYRPGAPPRPAVYIPDTDWAWRTMYAVVRVQGDPAAAATALEDRIRGVSPGVPVTRERTLDDVVKARTADVRLLARLGTIISAFALLLGVLGVYGVVAYAVRRRLPELGVRAALGASRSRLLRTEIVRHGRTVALGTGAGILASLAGGRLLTSFLYQVSAYDPLVLGGVAAVLGLVGLGAVWIPARRGAAVNPVDVLRAE